MEYLTAKYSDKVNIRAIMRKSGSDAFNGMPVEVCCDSTAVWSNFITSPKVVVGDIQKPLILGPVFKGATAAFFSTPCTTSRSCWLLLIVTCQCRAFRPR